MQQPSGKRSQPPIEPLQGVVERITYYSGESGYTVARLKASRTSELITIVGSFAKALGLLRLMRSPAI